MKNESERGELMDSRMKCIASTGDTFCTSVAASHPQHQHQTIGNGAGQDGTESNCFRAAQLSADGSTVVTYSEDLVYRSFVLPPNLLEPSDTPHHLSVFASSRQCQSTAFTLYPHFDLQYPSTTLALLAQKDLPTRLTNTLDFSYTNASYPWVNEYTEAFVQPSSLAFTTSGTHFIAGAVNELATFDLERTSEGPLEHRKTIKSKRARRLYGTASTEFSGIVTALAIDPEGSILAAGTTNRDIALFAREGRGEIITTFGLSVQDEKQVGSSGNGVSHIKWSGDGRYLFVAERQSDALLVYDIRVTGKRLGWLQGRRASTTHRLGFDFSDIPGQGVDVWAGGTDGMVRVWKDTTGREGPMEPDSVVEASADAVSSVLLHPTADVMVTTSGQRRAPHDLETHAEGDGDVGTGPFDNTLKVWSMD